MVSSEFWFGAEAGFYNSVATQSLRFDGTRATTLYRDIAQAGNRKIATYAFWLKFDATDTSFTVFSKGDGGGVQTSFDISIDSSRLRARFFESDSQTGLIRTNRLLRDSSAWYHIVVAIDVSQGTSSDRVKLYINGTQETSLESSSYPSDSNTVIGNNSAHTRERIGDSQMSYFPNTATGGSSSNRLNGYLCDFHHVDGQQLTPSSFGEFKNGTWIAIDYTGNHGDNGFRLEFKQTGDGQSTASSSTIGADTGVDGSGSATNNHFKDQNFESYDSAIADSPENNFCTFNPIGRRYGQSYTATFSEGNLKAVGGGNATHIWGTMAINQIASQGGVYFEVRLDSTDGNRSYGGLIGDNGINNKSSSSNGATYHYPIKALIDLMSSVAGHFTTATDGGSTINLSSNTGFSNGDIVGFAILSDGKFFCHRNGTYLTNADGNTGNPSTGANPIATIDLTEGDWIPYVGYNSSYSVNFGQDGTFAGQETSGGNQDANGIGNFMFAVPTNCLAICSSNMAEPTISPNANTQADDHFNTVLYTGNGGTQSITGVGFQPDWTWLKRRNGATSHRLMDSSRGDTKYLSSNTTNAEDITQGVFASFDTDGFSLNGTANAFNGNGNTYVGWNWKANGTTPTKTYKVVVVSDSGNKYRFRNSADSATFAQSAVTLDLQEGGTYTFDLSDSSMSGHPFVFSLTSNGTHGGGSEYTTNVTKTGTAGSAGASISITVASGVATLYYYCSSHSAMGGSINTNTTFGSTNFDGSILSVEQRNTTAGFSIITYTGNVIAGATVGHGLGVKPDFMIFKSRSSAGSWYVYHKSLTANNSIYLNLTNGSVDQLDSYNDTEPTSSIITFGDGSGTNSNSNTMVGYIFSEVEGYSKFGSYTGNGSSDGAFVFTGFRPAWIMLKRTDSADDWIMVDTTRATINDAGQTLFANLSDAETDYSTQMDIVSNGFKLRNNGGSKNASSGSYIYMAFAEQPFKYALGR